MAESSSAYDSRTHSNAIIIIIILSSRVVVVNRVVGCSPLIASPGACGGLISGVPEITVDKSSRCNYPENKISIYKYTPFPPNPNFICRFLITNRFLFHVSSVYTNKWVPRHSISPLNTPIKGTLRFAAAPLDRYLREQPDNPLLPLIHCLLQQRRPRIFTQLNRINKTGEQLKTANRCWKLLLLRHPHGNKMDLQSARLHYRSM